MTPLRTSTLIAAACGALLFVFAGIGVQSSELILMGGIALLLLAMAYLHTIPIARRVRQERLEFAWWLAHDAQSASGGAVTPGAPFTIRCYVRNRGTRTLRLTHLHPVLTDAAYLRGDDNDEILVPPQSRGEFAIRLTAPAVGRAVLHGLALQVRGPLGLFNVPLYFPTHLVVKVLPAAANRMRIGATPRTGATIDRESARADRIRGAGSEFLELRELRPGDPFKSIAWRPSARRGELLVRETESELQETRALIVDVSGTMRGGAPGKRKIDFVIDHVARLAQHTLDDGGRIGVTCLDARTVASVPIGEGRRHLLRVLDALVACTEIVDVDLTDIDADELAVLVANYVRHQDGIEFRRADGSLDLSHLAGYVVSRLDDQGRKGVVLAETLELEALRRYCRSRGIRIPYRPEPREGGKNSALVRMLREAGSAGRQPRSIDVVSDFDGVHDLDELVQVVRFLQLRGHAVTFSLADGRALTGKPTSALDASLQSVYGEAEERRMQQVERTFRRLGVTVERLGPSGAESRAAKRRSWERAA